MIDRTEELLETLEQDTQRRAYELVLAARQAGIPLMIISGRRTPQANQDVGGAAKSLHLSGRAFDVQVYGYTRDQIAFWWWEQVGLWAESNLGLHWGGHFQWPNAVLLAERDVNHFDTRQRLIQT